MTDTFDMTLRGEEVTVICDGVKVLEVIGSDGEDFPISDEEYTAISIRQTERMFADRD